MFKLSRKNIIVSSIFLVLALTLGIVTGYVLVYQKKVGLPEIKGLEDIKRVVMTTVYDDQGRLIKEFASEEKRRLVSYKDIPRVLKNAIITSEDNQYYEHWGINFRGLIRAIYGKAIGVYKGGGSSITQQLARNIYLTQRFTYTRKLKEQLRAIQLEKKYSKEQILTYYCNKIYFGGSIYGVGEAAGYYFGKHVKDLNLPEAVTLTVLIPTPGLLYRIFQNRGDVEKQKKLLIKKRNYILDKMALLGYINNKDREFAKKAELPVKPHIVNEDSVGDFYIEEVRRYLLKKYGYAALYSGGLKVHTGLNLEMQEWAEDALREGVRALDKRQGWRLDNKLRNILEEKKEPDTFSLSEWDKDDYIKEGAIVKGIVSSVSNKKAVVRIGDYSGSISARSARWTKYPLKRILKKGDVTLVKVGKIDVEKKSLEITLEQSPKAQAAIMVIDNKTGAVKAMVGGYSFAESEWNNATQALRQTGSTFKPLVFAAALENGYSAATIIDDSLKVFDNEWTIEPYEPSNHGDKFRGPVTLRYALEKSINVVTAKMVERLTPPMVVQYAKKFGITAPMQPVMSMGLGTLGISLKEMTAAYTVFPNIGVRVNPYYIEKIENQNNRMVERSYSERRRVLNRPVAYIMNYIMQGVVQYGTGAKARNLRAPVGGKTGTTDDYSDAWFIGFSPSVTVGVWVGYQGTNESLGDGEEGSKAAAPIFVKFMEKYLEKNAEPIMEYPRPKGIVFVKIDKMTGKLLTGNCVYPFNEAFVSGTEPHEYCSEEDHLNCVDYYKTNGYDILTEETRKKKREKEEQERLEREAAEAEAQNR